VQAKSATVGPRCESVIEQSIQILFGNPNAVVFDFNANFIVAATGRDSNFAANLVRINTGMFCVSNQVDDDLEDPVLVDFNHQLWCKVTKDLNAMSLQR